MDSLQILLQGACRISHDERTIFENVALEDVDVKVSPARTRRNAFSVDRKADVVLID